MAVALNWVMFALAFGILEAFGFGDRAILFVFFLVSLSSPMLSYVAAYIGCRGSNRHWSTFSASYAGLFLLIGILAELVPEALTKT